ncbi:hypothetical protein [Gilliamella sp. wkB112]|uniref:hypothetical protein n=1 Tax=Gilliamella sp. wkB112 TaxID=3120257 RepID=UPI00080EB023|nr:hypothetical protein [Gilliamella apicola]OCG05722.1 hypothetical protein A9G12_00100 [Gilliamella apicola]
MKGHNKLYKIIIGLFCYFITMQATAKYNTVVAPMKLDITQYNKLKKQHYNDFRGTNEFTIQKDKDTTIRYMEDSEYTLITTIKEVYIIKRVYYKPTGVLKSEIERFNNIEINTAKYYDEQGQLTEEYKYTSPDWVDRLTKVVKEKFNVDLWYLGQAMLYQINYQGKKVLLIYHLKGKLLDFQSGNSFLYFALLDYSSLEILLQGEMHQEPLRIEGDNYLPIKPAVHLVNGKPIDLE